MTEPTRPLDLGGVLADQHVQAAEFNEKIIGYPAPAVPTILSFERGEFRLGHLREELAEIELNLSNENLEEVVDGLIDLMYVAHGALYEMGITSRAAFEAVHEANMRKRQGAKSTRPSGQGYDAIKPEGWMPPDMEALLNVRLCDAGMVELFRRSFGDHYVAMGGGARCLVTSKEDRDRFMVLDANDPGRVLINAVNGRCGGDYVTIAGVDGIVRTTSRENYDRLGREAIRPRMEGHSIEDAFALPPLEYCPDPDVRTKPRVLIIGHGRHGKDTVAEMLRDRYGLRFESSSMFAAERIMMPAFARHPERETYSTVEECYADRSNHRAFWHDEIAAYCLEDPTRLARELYEDHDVYVGLRASREYHACQNSGMFDLIIWVDASERLPLEDRSSMKLEPWMAHYVIDNNGTEEQLAAEVERLARAVGLDR